MADLKLGVPIWVDLGTSDLDGALQFYAQLFGWTTQDLGEQFGNYNMQYKDGKMVAGIGRIMMPQQPVAWSVCFCTLDANATAKAVTEGGGKVLSGPMEVPGQGTLGVFMDPVGGAFSVWQPGEHNKCAELTEAPGSFCWNELATRDLPGAKTFYPRVFGWSIRTSEMPGHGEYVEWQVDGKSVAGGMGMGDMYPPQVPPHWLTYFAVEDTDASMAKVTSLGGKVIVPATDIPQGRFAVVSDPQGAAFGIIKTSGM